MGTTIAAHGAAGLSSARRSEAELTDVHRSTEVDAATAAGVIDLTEGLRALAPDEQLQHLVKEHGTAMYRVAHADPRDAEAHGRIALASPSKR
jgi:hypothetical protein